LRTVKQVSDLTGISVRMLHYYDKIGLLKPSEITKTGYRLYDDEALKTLQQILFFKELDIPLKEVKEIMVSAQFDKMIETMKANEAEIDKSAIKQYGSIERYAEAAKKNLNNSVMQNITEQYDKFKKDCLENKHPKLEELYKKLVSDLNKDPSSKEIQKIVSEIAATYKKQHKALNVDVEDNFLGTMADLYSKPAYIKAFDEKHKSGSSKFIGEALKFYSENSK
jgi:DNA-binding transcriptional MerR regulator